MGYDGMVLTMVNVGFRNFVVGERIIAVVDSDSAPMRRLVQERRKNGYLIDTTHGRRTKSVIFIDSGQLIASALTQETVAKRMSGTELALESIEETEAE